METTGDGITWSSWEAASRGSGTHSHFGHPEWAGFAPGLKTIDDARDIRERVLLAFEAAEREPDPERQRDWLTTGLHANRLPSRCARHGSGAARALFRAPRSGPLPGERGHSRGEKGATFARS